jgi:transposase
VQKVFGWTAEIVRHPPKLVPEEVMKRWVRELTEEGLRIDWEKLREEPKGLRPFLPRRWIVERTFSWLGQNRRRRMSEDYERLPETGEALIYAAMRLFRQFHGEVRTRRLLRGWCTKEGGRERPEGKGPRHVALPLSHPSLSR